MKKTCALVVSLIMLLAFVAGCSAPATEAPAVKETPVAAAEPAVTAAPAAEPATEPVAEPAAEPVKDKKASGNYNITLGCIQPGPEYYYQTLFDCVRISAESVGMKVVTLMSEYSPATELSNIEDLISQGVDAIMMFAVSGDSGQVAAQVCEKENMPLFLVDSTASEGPSKPICTIKKDFYESGVMNGQWLVDNFKGEMKIGEITSLLGYSIAEPTSEGFAKAISARTDAKVVVQGAADWVRAKAMQITEDWISSGVDINLIFVHNEDMGAGVVSALEAAGMLGTEIVVVAQNGSPEGLDMIRKGQLLSTVATNPSTQAGNSVVMLMKYLDGESVPEVFDNPVYVFDATNVDDPTLATWDVSWALKLVDEYLNS